MPRPVVGMRVFLRLRIASGSRHMKILSIFVSCRTTIVRHSQHASSIAPILVFCVEANLMLI